MKIVTIVGARPQFIKTAVVSRKLREIHEEILVHTGQHYDKNMSDIFFAELGIPVPDYNLGICGGLHGQMTGRMLAAVEEILIREDPGAVLVYGDTNSTLAGALAAVKLHIPVAHVEAGIRFGTLKNPEEVNRLLTDRISSKLFCPSESSVHNLRLEGITEGVYLTGDPMYDAFLQYSKQAPALAELTTIDGGAVKVPQRYYYLTCHREENANAAALIEIFNAMAQLDAPVIYSVHPRNAERAKSLLCTNVILVQPVGYLDSLALLNNCEKVITDSGGLQREAFWAKKQCVTLLENELWPETHVDNRNQLSGCVSGEILEKLSSPTAVDDNYKPFGDGSATEKILCAIENAGRKTN